MNWLTKLFRKLFGVKCPECQGIGMIVIYNDWIGGCPVCDGKGRIKEKSEK